MVKSNTDLQIKMAKIETNLDNIKDSLEIHVQDQKEDFNHIMNKLDNMHNSFAGKWVEKVAIGSVLAILTAIVTFVFTS